MENIEIVKITADAIEQLKTIGIQTFFETFAAGNTEENMQRYLKESFSDEILLAELTNPSSEFYFAQMGSRVIGYLKINLGTAQTESKEENALEIERIYVLNEFHGKKIGQILFNKAIEIAKNKNVSHVWLGVWEENQKAINFYTKNGFEVFDKHIFKLGDDEQTDLMMKLKMHNH